MRVFLGAGVRTGSVELRVQEYDGTGSVEIIGAGQNDAVLTAPLRRLHRGTDPEGWVGSSVRDLTVRLPQYSNGDGLYTSNAARRIYVTDEYDQSHPRHGVTLVSGGTLEDSEVRLVREPNATAVELGLGGGPFAARLRAPARA